MGFLTNVRPNTVFEKDIGFNTDIAVLITEYSYSKRRKYCVRSPLPYLILVLNGFTFRLEEKSHQRRICGEYYLSILNSMIS